MVERTKTTLAIFTGLAILYAICVLGFVASSPDLRMRFLLDPPADEAGLERGMRIRGDVGLVSSSAEPNAPAPRVGDVVLEIDDERIRSFLDFTSQLVRLRGRTVGTDGALGEGEDPAKLVTLWPSLTEEPDGTRWVRVRFRPREAENSQIVWLQVQSVPWGELVLSLVWFLCQLGVLLVAALTAWNRPFDRAARLFLVMSIVACFAFVGGFHWWLVAGSAWLNAPFLVSALLLPAVTLHFFLVYPRPRPLLTAVPRTAMAVLYAVPLVVVVAAVGLVFAAHHFEEVAHRLESPEDGPPAVADVERVAERAAVAQEWLRLLVRGYLFVAAGYFVATIVALVHGFATTRNPIERGQVKWILGAAMLSTLPLAFTLYLAVFSRDEFAAGHGRVPMFLASLSFLLAYTVGMVRYRMMLAAQFVTRSTRYYVVTSLLTLALAGAITTAAVLGVGFPHSATQQQVMAMSAVLLVAVVLLIWLRDRFQGMADRTFFAEKYRLDEALQQMNADGGPLADPGSLGQRMLRTCREVLRVEWAVLLLREGQTRRFRLVAADGVENVPLELDLDDDAVEELRRRGTTQRIRGSSGDGDGSVSRLLGRLGGDLLHPFHVERRLAGVVVLGSKQEGVGYSAEDVTFLHALGQITSIALHAAHVHQEIGRLNEQLRTKVDTVVKQQRQIARLRAELESLEVPQPALPKPATDADVPGRGEIRGRGASMQRVLETVWKVADSEVSVLVRGESGTGKELVAQVLHENSPRRNGPLVRVNCAALSPTLLESELFGHVKGAFTGAHRDRVGRFELADGGTLFLDEIGDVSLETQVKLLRVVQERCFERVGGAETIHVDVRLVAATHQNLERLIREGRFREDLYYRLNVVTVHVPPLRDRLEDLPELLLHFLRRSCERTGKKIRSVDDAAWAALEGHHWPGNVRELQNVAERAVVLADGDTIGLRELPTEVTAPEPRRKPVPAVEREPVAAGAASSDGRGNRAETASDGTADWSPPDEADEREVLVSALRRADGNKTRAARLLGMPRSTYYSKLRKLTGE